MTELLRKYAITDITAKADDGQAGAVWPFVLASGGVDRYGDRILVSGMDTSNFARNPIALYGHATSAPVGRWSSLRKAGTDFDAKLLGDLVLAPSGASAPVDEVRALLQAGVLKAASVGLLVVRSKPNAFGGDDILESELVECSIVSIPANPEALLAAGYAAGIGSRRSLRDVDVVLGDAAIIVDGHPLTADVLAASFADAMARACGTPAVQQRLLVAALGVFA